MAKPFYTKKAGRWMGKVKQANGTWKNVSLSDKVAFSDEVPADVWARFRAICEDKPLEDVSREKACVEGTLADAVSQYLNGKRMRKAAVNTTRLREHSLKWFLRWCEQSGKTELREITKRDGREYVSWLTEQKSDRGRPFEHSSLKGMLGYTSGFFTFAINSELYEGVNPIKGARDILDSAPEKERAAKRQAYTEEQVRDLFKALEENGKYELRDVCKVAMNTGLRIEAVRNLCKSWIRADEDGVEYLYIPREFSKTDGPYKGYLNSVTKEIILRRTASGNDRVFKNLAKTSVYAKLQRFIRRHKLTDIKNYCHAMRRTFGTLMYNRGVPLKTISIYLNHTTVKTTEGYLKIKPGDLHDQANGFSL